VLSYLSYPIERSFMYGVESDVIMQRLARRSQAAFNIIAVMEPQLHDWDLTYEAALQNVGAMRQRKNFAPLFLAVFQNLGFFVSMDGSKLVGEDNMITLGDAAIRHPPHILHALMLNDPGIAAAPMFVSQAFSRHLRTQEVVAGLAAATSALHEVREPA
jgi:hypothetical protein